ncbi:MAG: YfcE family phosphodiesterase [Candidatus Baldrarchaeia archaeon]
MKKILVIGDFHIPDRAKSIPEQISAIINRENFDLVISTGDFTTRDTLKMLEKIAPVKWVIGNMDYITGPETERVEIDGIKIGITHGTYVYPRGNPYQLRQIALKMKVNVLISGHTHALSIHKFDDVLLLNPGSATGVWGGGPASMKPSFMILEIEGNSIRVRAYELEKSGLKEIVKTYRIEGNKIVEG